MPSTMNCTTDEFKDKMPYCVQYNPYHTDHFGCYMLTGETDKKGRPCNAWTHIYEIKEAIADLNAIVEREQGNLEASVANETDSSGQAVVYAFNNAVELRRASDTLINIVATLRDRTAK